MNPDAPNPDLLPNGRWILPGICRSASVDDANVTGFVTVLDLRNEAGPRHTHHIPLELGLDGHPVFEAMKIETQLATPAYYAGFCTHWPSRVWAAVEAVETLPRPLLFHCQSGWDRTGMIAALVLLRSGANIEEALVDYAETREGSAAEELAQRDALGPWEAPLRAWLSSAWVGELVNGRRSRGSAPR